MILLNVDGKALLKPGSWQEIYELPGYMDRVDSKAQRLREIIGQYALPDRNPCGLRNCRTPHNRGYVVLVGGKGAVTNIGNVCGKKHFGVDFEQSKNRFNQAVNAQLYRQRIAEKQNHIPSLLARLDALQSKHSCECYTKMHGYMTRTFDERTSKTLKEKARRGDNRITRAVRIDKDERELGLGFDREEEYRDELLFTISGVQAVNSYVKLTPRKLEVLRSELEAFREIDPDSLSYMGLKQHDNWVKRIDEVIDELDEVLADCVRFLSGGNIKGVIQHKHSLSVR